MGEGCFSDGGGASFLSGGGGTPWGDVKFGGGGAAQKNCKMGGHLPTLWETLMPENNFGT